MSKVVHKCPSCGRRVKRGRQANVRITERASGRERRQDAALFMSSHPRNSRTIHYFHPAGCSARQKFACGCFTVEQAA